MSNNRNNFKKAPTAPILITLRVNQGKRMHAAFFDHYLMRKITGHLTTVSKSASQDEESLHKFITSKDHSLTLGMNAQEGQRIIPAVTTGLNQSGGLLFIPGRAKDDNDVDRTKHETAIIKDALLHGRPILAVCAGSWRLWESLGGKLKAVDDHCYANMPYIVTNGDVGNNVAVHRITIKPRALIADCMTIKDEVSPEQYPKVNSVHWMAPDPSFCPDKVSVSAKAKVDNAIKIKKRSSNKMTPTEDTIEAFERYGSPTLGVLWHPEAYYQKNPDLENERHLNIIRYMAKAGDAYQAKQKMLKEFKNTVMPLVDNHGIFRKKAVDKKQAGTKFVDDDKKKTLNI
jgi:gamma-glutamyl-gamma-aminobutyrate hydrolase PuuD